MANEPRYLAQRDYLPRLQSAIAEVAAGSAATFAGIHARVTTLLAIPPSLTQLPLVLQSLASVLPVASRFHPHLANELDQIDQWCGFINSIPAEHTFWKMELFRGKKAPAGVPGAHATGAPMKRRHKGIVLTHPLWVALGYTSETPLNTPAGDTRRWAFCNVQANILAAFVQRASQGDEPHYRIGDACWLLRQFGGDYAGSNEDATQRNARLMRLRCLEQYADAGSADDLFAVAKQQHAEPYPIGPGAGAFAELLSDTFALKHPPVIRHVEAGKRAQGKRHRGRTRLNEEIYPGFRSYELLSDGFGRDEADGGFSITLSSNEPEFATAETLDAAGIDPAEYARSDTTWVGVEGFAELRGTPDAPVGKTLPPLASVYGMARARARAQRLSAQRFTTRRGRVTAPEFARILSVLDAAYVAVLQRRQANSTGSGLTRSATSDRLLQETLVLAGIVIATGTNPAGAIAVHHWPGNPGSLPSNWQLAYSLAEGGIWRRPCLVPVRGPQVPLPGQAASNMPTVPLSDLWGVGSKLCSLGPQGQWFQHSLAQLTAAFKRNISKLLEHAGVTKTWRSLDAFADLLPEWFSGMEEGDQLRVAFLFARNDPMAAVHLYYTAFDPFMLDAWHVKSVTDLQKRLAANGFVVRADELADGLFSSSPAASIGRRLTGDDRILDPKFLRKTTTTLREQARRPGTDRMEDVVRQHNYLTAYVGAVLAICTGFRSVRTPIPDLTAIDPETGCMPLQEKDSDGNAHGRIVCLPDRLREQIDTYLTHLRQLWSWLPTKTSKTLEVEATKQRDRSRYGSDTFHLDLGCTLFFLKIVEGEVVAQEFTGALLKASVEEVCPKSWPFDNSGRHFLRSWLSHKECPATIINAAMGHSNTGEFPWAPESAMDPYRYREVLLQYLDQLLNELHFEVVR